jgi:hypothetical protein
MDDQKLYIEPDAARLPESLAYPGGVKFRDLSLAEARSVALSMAQQLDLPCAAARRSRRRPSRRLSQESWKSAWPTPPWTGLVRTQCFAAVVQARCSRVKYLTAS